MSNFKLGEKLNQQVLNIIFIVDQSGCMEGSSIRAVNHAIKDTIDMMPEIQADTSDVEIRLNVLAFSDDAYWLYPESKKVDEFVWNDLSSGGATNLTAAYDALAVKIRRVSNGGMMPDFGGVAPILILMTDGLPTSTDWEESCERLFKIGWYHVALKYALAINIDTPDARYVLERFTGNNETILKVYSAQALRKVIRVIAVTASKIKSKSATTLSSSNSMNTQAQIEISEALADVEDLEIGW